MHKKSTENPFTYLKEWQTKKLGMRNCKKAKIKHEKKNYGAMHVCVCLTNACMHKSTWTMQSMNTPRKKGLPDICRGHEGKEHPSRAFVLGFVVCLCVFTFVRIYTKPINPRGRRHSDSNSRSCTSLHKKALFWDAPVWIMKQGKGKKGTSSSKPFPSREVTFFSSSYM